MSILYLCLKAAGFINKKTFKLNDKSIFMIKERNLLLSTAILSLIGFIFCLVGFYLNWFSGVDLFFNRLAVSIQGNWLTYTAVFIANLFDPISVVIMLLVFVIGFWIRDFKSDAKKLALFSVLLGLILLLVKNLVDRARPLNMLVTENSFSFPSGHAAAGVVLFGLICYYLIFRFKLVVNQFSKFLLYSVSILFVFLISFSRIYLNVHWFSDVLGGLFLGLFLLMGFLFFEKALWS